MYLLAMGLFRTILRRLFYTAAAVSMLLLFATLIFWPVSYFRSCFAAYMPASTMDPAWTDYDSHCRDEYGVVSNSGRVTVIYETLRNDVNQYPFYFAAGKPDFGHWSYLTWKSAPGGSGAPAATTLGVGWSYYESAGTVQAYLFIPLSYLALLFSLLPLLAFRSIRRRRKAARDARTGLCPACGYNLLAHKIGQRCPECGTLILPPTPPS